MKRMKEDLLVLPDKEKNDKVKRKYYYKVKNEIYKS